MKATIDQAGGIVIPVATRAGRSGGRGGPGDGVRVLSARELSDELAREPQA